MVVPIEAKNIPGEEPND